MTKKQPLDDNEGTDRFAISAAYFHEFMQGMEKVSKASQKIIEMGQNFVDVSDFLKAAEKFDNLPIKAFGDGGSHIVIRGHQHVGKKTKVIVKN